MADGARRQAVLMQGVVPSLNVEAGELLQGLGADVRRDLVFHQLSIALRRPG